MDSLIPTYQALAESMPGNFGGTSILNHVKSIKQLATAVGAQTMLDFGCGRGDAYRSPHKLHHEIGLPRSAVTLYDPAFRPSATLPTGTYDLVVCSDVLEHIPEAEVDAFIERLFGYARKGVWASVCCRKAKKFFPGTDTNMHVTVQPYEWWEEKFLLSSARCGKNPPPWGAVQVTLVETP